MFKKNQTCFLFKFKTSLFIIFAITSSIISCDDGKFSKKKIVSNNQNVDNNTFSGTNTKSLVKDSTNIDLMLALGADLYLKKEYESAFNQFLAVYNIDNKNITAIVNIGNLYYDTEQNNEAIGFYQQALDIDPNLLSVRCDMATCYSRIGKFKEAIEINKKNIEIDYNHVQSHHNLSLFYKEIGNLKEAEAEVKIFNQLSSGTH